MSTFEEAACTIADELQHTCPGAAAFAHQIRTLGREMSHYVKYLRPGAPPSPSCSGEITSIVPIPPITHIFDTDGARTFCGAKHSLSVPDWQVNSRSTCPTCIRLHLQRGERHLRWQASIPGHWSALNDDFDRILRRARDQAAAMGKMAYVKRNR